MSRKWIPFYEWAGREPEFVEWRDRHKPHPDMRDRNTYTKPGSFRQMCAEYGNCCVCCGQQFPDHKGLTRDHIVPVSAGGHSRESNIQPLCQTCNQKKGIQVIDYRMAELARQLKVRAVIVRNVIRWQPMIDINGADVWEINEAA
jgi:5-methylcytosine-specific restriction endonuclease McrA